jgi:hypothetical protein
MAKAVISTEPVNTREAMAKALEWSIDVRKLVVSDTETYIGGGEERELIGERHAPVTV